MLGGGLALQLALSGWAPPADGLLVDCLGWAHLPWDVDVDRALLVAASRSRSSRPATSSCGLCSSAPARCGPSRSTATSPTRSCAAGGCSGPRERLFILGLGLAGELTAAGLVVAAKGLIHWPELTVRTIPSQRRPDPGSNTKSDIDTVTEYFLVGSFVSWLLALAALLSR